jgi:soluble lytic murein transglycosylase-like protein
MTVIYNKELQYLPYIQAASSKYNVPVALILAHMKQESAFNPKAFRAEPQINDASTGLLQLLVKTAQGLDSSASHEKLLDPAYNIDLGVRYMSQNLKRYNGNIQDEIASYNAGSVYKNAAGQYTNSKGSTNVQDYVNKVTTNYNDYVKWLSAGSSTVSVAAVNPVLLVSFGILVLAVVFGGVMYARRK